MSGTSVQARIVRAWRDMELFSPQTVEKAKPGDATTPSIDWKCGDLLPWEQGSYLERRPAHPGRVWRHTVYLWIYDLITLYECLDHIYQEDDEVFDERPPGQSSAAAFIVDEQGRIDFSSVTLSSAAWGLGRALGSAKRSDRWFPDFASADQQFRELVTTELGRKSDGQPQILTQDLMLLLGGLVRRATGLPKKSAQTPQSRWGSDAEGADPLPMTCVARIRSVLVKPETEISTDFLNSFILDDLGLAAESVERGTESATLAAYLAGAVGPAPGHRHDTVAAPTEMLKHLTPESLPYGRWPSSPKHALATSQQLAVNLSLGDLRGDGLALRTVNGPPGTGKTTLLRDVLAGLITERARVLAGLRRPEDAFSGIQHRWEAGYRRIIHGLIPQLTGFEVVVCSANNAAVQNISDELPRADSVNPPWSDADYLSNVATHVRRSLTNDDTTNAWGLIAARLGNKANRRAFTYAAWTHKKDWQSAPYGLRHLLEEAKITARRPWADAVRDFRDALATVEVLRAHAQTAQAALTRYAVIDNEITAASAQLAALRTAESRADAEAQRTEGELTAAALAHDTALATLDEHTRQRPSWWANLFSGGAARRDWARAESPLRITVKATSARRDRAESMREEATTLLTALRVDLAASHAAHIRLLAERDHLVRTCTNDKKRWGDSYPDDEWFRDDTRRETTAPWCSPEFNEARSTAFLAALTLHVEWFRHCPEKLIQSLRGTMDVVGGQAPNNLPEDTALAAWQTFFLFVPLVSTTFASLGRMFSHLGPESLGWVFIDEAGQATPQAAVGALWRAHHALIVGDPLQLTPVVTLPPKAEANMVLEHGVPQSVRPSKTSAQALADASNPWGTLMHQGDDALWVGTPLRIHRRCDDPMFTISNEVAYGNTMIHGIPVDQRQASSLRPSAWLHVPAQSGNGHALRADHRIARCIIRDLLSGAASDEGKPLDADEIIAISPFRAMANELARFPDNIGAPSLRSGTVHKAQGQEAIAVVFVLGGDPHKPGARAWAAATPNLVNVAASRAKKRLYVIGDYDAWAGLQHFSTVAKYLPRCDVSVDRPWG